MEIGKYIDFHANSNSGDYSHRIIANDDGSLNFSGNLYFPNLPTSNSGSTTVNTNEDISLNFSNTHQGVQRALKFHNGFDVARFGCGNDFANGNLFLEIATANEGNEAIVVRQYNGDFVSVAHEAIILDGNGNTSFPKSLTVNGINILTELEDVLRRLKTLEILKESTIRSVTIDEPEMYTVHVESGKYFVGDTIELNSKTKLYERVESNDIGTKITSLDTDESNTVIVNHL